MSDNLRPITVLLTGCGAPGAPGIIKCLRKNGERDIRIVGVDMNENAGARGMVDAFYTVPAAKDIHFIDRILEICRLENVDVVEPIVTRELMKFAEAVSEFEKINVKVVVMDPSVLAVVNNKANLLKAMKAAGFPTAEFEVVHTVEELKAAFQKLGYPQKAICVKGAEGNGSRGVRIVDPSISRYDLFFNSKPNSMHISYDELITTLSEKDTIPEMLVMEHLPGEEYGVDVLCKDGEILAQIGRYNYDVNSSIPQGCIIEKREVPFALSAQICEKFGLNFHANFDFKYDASGVPQLIEINPRLSATIVSYAAAGVNFPYLGIKCILGEEISECSPLYGTRMMRHYQEEFFAPDGSPINW